MFSFWGTLSKLQVESLKFDVRRSEFGVRSSKGRSWIFVVLSSTFDGFCVFAIELRLMLGSLCPADIGAGSCGVNNRWYQGIVCRARLGVQFKASLRFSIEF